MYIFDFNRRYNRRRYRSIMYIPVSHTNWGSIKNTIGVVVNRLVGMGLKEYIKLDELPALRYNCSLYQTGVPAWYYLTPPYIPRHRGRYKIINEWRHVNMSYEGYGPIVLFLLSMVLFSV